MSSSECELCGGTEEIPLIGPHTTSCPCTDSRTALVQLIPTRQMTSRIPVQGSNMHVTVTDGDKLLTWEEGNDLYVEVLYSGDTPEVEGKPFRVDREVKKSWTEFFFGGPSIPHTDIEKTDFGKIPEDEREDIREKIRNW